MNVFDQAWHWLTTSDNWWTTTEVTASFIWRGCISRSPPISVFFAAVIGLSIGITLGHFRRGGALVTLLANAHPGRSDARRS